MKIINLSWNRGILGVERDLGVCDFIFYLVLEVFGKVFFSVFFRFVFRYRGERILFNFDFKRDELFIFE